MNWRISSNSSQQAFVISFSQISSPLNLRMRTAPVQRHQLRTKISSVLPSCDLISESWILVFSTSSRQEWSPELHMTPKCKPRSFSSPWLLYSQIWLLDLRWTHVPWNQQWSVPCTCFMTLSNWKSFIFQDTTTLQIQPAQMIFLLEDLVCKQQHSLLASIVKRQSFFKVCLVLIRLKAHPAEIMNVSEWLHAE